MGDGISILTNLSKAGAVSRIVQGQQTAADSQEKLAKQLESKQEPESVLLKDVEENERTRLKERRDERRRRRRRREAKAQKEAAGSERVGRRIDLKV